MAKKKETVKEEILIHKGGTEGLPHEEILFNELKALVNSTNKVGLAIQQAYECKPAVLKPEIKIPAVKKPKGSGGIKGMIHEKWLFNQLKTISSNLSKMSAVVQKNVQKAVKANATAKKKSATKVTAKKASAAKAVKAK